MTLETEDFATLGRWLAEIDVPAAAILEGGYSDDLPGINRCVSHRVGRLISIRLSNSSAAISISA